MHASHKAARTVVRSIGWFGAPSGRRILHHAGIDPGAVLGHPVNVGPGR